MKTRKSNQRSMQKARARNKYQRQKKEYRTRNPIFEVEITTISDDGEPFALPSDKTWAGQFPRILVDPKINVGIGDILTIEIVDVIDGTAFAQPVKLHEPEHRPTFLAQIQGKNPAVGGPCAVRAFHRDLQSVDFILHQAPPEVPENAIIRVTAGSRPRRGPTPVSFTEFIAPTADGLESQIALDNHNIPQDFPAEALTYTADLNPFTSKDIVKREDLRKLPLVTIDGADARDFDDAVYAEEWQNGYHIIVAIADVAHYVLPESDLDQEAQHRGNSVYLPDTVIPMLPEKLSNNLCSLVPQEDRPVLAVHLYIDDKGRLKKHHFSRAVIHSHARLTYEQAQEALDGNEQAVPKNILENTLIPLKSAAEILLQARKNRHALELDLPELQLQLNEHSEVTGIKAKPRLFTHQLIEECMILANVAAATALETKGVPCVYRTHPAPGKEKLEGLRNLLKTYNLTFAKSNAPSQQDFGKLTQKLRGHPQKDILMRTLLQTQQQAKYDPNNIGHYGLALQRYAHFTSPIRRYADLLVHRQLIHTLKLGGNGGHDNPHKSLKSTCDHINITERRAQQAEWEARDRFTAKYYAKYVNETFTAQIINILKFGMFIRIDGIAEGLLPLRLLGDDYYAYNPKTLSLKGKRSGRTFKIGQQIQAKLIGADPIDGKLTFTLAK